MNGKKYFTCGKSDLNRFYFDKREFCLYLLIDASFFGMTNLL